MRHWAVVREAAQTLGRSGFNITILRYGGRILRAKSKAAARFCTEVTALMEDVSSWELAQESRLLSIFQQPALDLCHRSGVRNTILSAEKTNEDKVALHSAFLSRNGYLRPLRGCHRQAVRPHPVETCGSIPVRGGAGDASKPLWSRDQCGWIHAGGDDFRAAVVPSPAYAAR
jgi:hypothetical protein